MLNQQLLSDVEKIQRLSSVPTILEIICRTTGMGFSAVARVTEDKWIACAVRDQINFGLQPGGELQIETTICNEIRGHGQPVVIDEVATDDTFCNHHTPKQYGFQSYISIPIILKDGSFFGTLCAIDPRPFPLKSSNMVGMFNLFADLIAYHLLSEDEIRAKEQRLQQTEKKLSQSINDIRQYTHISRHTFQEPLRKMRLYTDMLMNYVNIEPNARTKQLAGKINTLSRDFSEMIRELNEFADLDQLGGEFEVVDLNTVLYTVVNKLRLKVEEKGTTIRQELLHHIHAIPEQITRLFYHLISNALNFSRPGVVPVIKIYSKDLNEAPSTDLDPGLSYCEICIEDNGIGIEPQQLDKVFDLFSRLNPREKYEGIGMGLPQSKRIVMNHGGTLNIHSELGKGTTVSLILPINRMSRISLIERIADTVV